MHLMHSLSALYRWHWTIPVRGGKGYSFFGASFTLIYRLFRTTITVAHRLSTIKHSDVIHVIEDGRVLETGSHEELIRKRGRYLALVQAQL